MSLLAAIPGLDTQIGLNNLAGKTTSYINKLGKFAARQSVEMDELNQSLAKGDRVTAKRIAHTLKGLAGTMGAVSLQSNARRLEVAIREQFASGPTQDLVEAVMSEYSSLAEAIQTELSKLPR